MLNAATSIAAKYLVGKDAAQARLAQRICDVIGSLSSRTVRDLLLPHSDQLRDHFCKALHADRVKQIPHIEALGHTVALLFILKLKLPKFLGTNGYFEVLRVNMRRDVSQRLTPRRIVTLQQLRIANLKALRAVLFQSDTSTLTPESSKQLVLLFAHEVRSSCLFFGGAPILLFAHSILTFFCLLSILFLSQAVVSLMSSTADVQETAVEALVTLMDPARAGSHPTLGATVPKIVDALVNVTRQFVRLRASVLNGIARVVAAAPARFAAARVATAGGEYSLRMVLVQNTKRWLQQASDSVAAPQRRCDFRLLDSIMLVLQNMQPDESDMSDVMGLWCSPQLRHPYIAPLARYASAHPAAALAFVFPSATGCTAAVMATRRELFIHALECPCAAPLRAACSTSGAVTHVLRWVASNAPAAVGLGAQVRSSFLCLLISFVCSYCLVCTLLTYCFVLPSALRRRTGPASPSRLVRSSSSGWRFGSKSSQYSTSACRRRRVAATAARRTASPPRAGQVSVLLFTVTLYANLAHSFTRSP